MYFHSPTPHGLNDVLRDFRNDCRAADLDEYMVIRVVEWLVRHPKWAAHLGLDCEMAASLASEMLNDALARWPARLEEK